MVVEVASRMKTASAKAAGIPFVVQNDKHGVPRRKYQRLCSSCGTEEWLGCSWFKKQQLRCKKCASKDGPSPEAREKISATLRKTFSSPSYKELFRQRILEQNRKGPTHWNWKGGITSINQQERNTEPMLTWKRLVMERDLYHCVVCKKQSDNLVAHHIQPYSAFPELRTDIKNGMTLCSPCHKFIHTYFREAQWLQQ